MFGKSVKLLPLVGIIILAIILGTFDLGRVWETVVSINIGIMLLFLLLHVPILALRAWKWKRILGMLGYEFAMKDATASWLGGFAVSLVTPGRIGDFSRAFYAEKRLGRIGRPLLGVAVDRVLDVLILLAFGVAGAAFFVSLTGYGLLLVVGAAAAALAALVLAAARKGLVAFLLRPVFRRLLPERFKADTSSVFSDFYGGIAGLKRCKGRLAAVTLMAVACWVMTILQFTVLAQSLSLDINILYMFMAMPLAIFMDMLPVSFAGLGTRESALIFLLSFAGLSAESSISFSLLLFLLGYVAVGIVGFAVWMRNPSRLLPAKAAEAAGSLKAAEGAGRSEAAGPP